MRLLLCLQKNEWTLYVTKAVKNDILLTNGQLGITFMNSRSIKIRRPIEYSLITQTDNSATCSILMELEYIKEDKRLSKI